MKGSRLIALLGAGALAAGVMAAPTVASATPGIEVCGGPAQAPATLHSTGGNAIVNGFCAVDDGPTTIGGNVIISPGATNALVSAFGQGGSRLTVGGNVIVGQGSAAILGCFASSFPCVDDPASNNPALPPTLNSHTIVRGSLVATSPLGVIVHDTTVSGSVIESGGGGGVTCDTTPGIFGLFGSPAYSDYEDSSVGGSFSVTGLRSCWFGTLRVNIGGTANYSHNTLADPDGSEVNSNTVHGSLICVGNSPAVQFGDGMGTPNVVGGVAVGECGFNVLQPRPAPNGPLTHISVRG